MKFVGAVLIVTPFVLLTAHMVRDGGWRVALLTWAVVFAVIASLSVGAWLLAH